MDRRKIENDLVNSGFTPMQGETLSYLFAEMATKEDLRELRSEMRSESHALRGEMQVMKAELQAAIAESGERTMQAIADLQNKLFTHVLALIGALTAILTLIEFLMR